MTIGGHMSSNLVLLTDQRDMLSSLTDIGVAYENRWSDFKFLSTFVQMPFGDE